MVNRLRTALSDKSVRAGTVLASWAKVDGLVDEGDAVAFLADKEGSRARGKARANAEASSEDELEAGEISYTEPDDDTGLGSSSAAGEPPSSDDDLYL